MLMEHAFSQIELVLWSNAPVGMKPSSRFARSVQRVESVCKHFAANTTFPVLVFVMVGLRTSILLVVSVRVQTNCRVVLVTSSCYNSDSFLFHVRSLPEK